MKKQNRLYERSEPVRKTTGCLQCSQKREKVVTTSDSLEPPESKAKQYCFVHQSSPEDTQSSGGSLQNGSPSKVFRFDGSPQTSFFGNLWGLTATVVAKFLIVVLYLVTRNVGGLTAQVVAIFGCYIGVVLYLVTQKTLGKVGHILQDWHAFRKKTFSSISCKFSMTDVFFFVTFSSLFCTVLCENCLDCIDLADPKNCYQKHAQDCLEYRYVNLSSSNRSDLPSDLSVNFPNVDELHLANNKFVLVPDRAIRGFTKLNLLDMDGNKISNFNESYASLQTLTVLSLMQNVITKLPNYFNRMLPNLKAAYFGNNMITEVPYLDLNDSNLAILGLANNPLENLNLGQFDRPETVSRITANKDDILVYVNGRSSPLQIIIQGSNLICEENIHEFHQSIDVNGTISCKYRNGSKGEVSLLHVTKTDPVVTTSVPTTPSVPTQNNSNVAVIVSVVLVVVGLVIAVFVICYRKLRGNKPV